MEDFLKQVGLERNILHVPVFLVHGGLLFRPETTWCGKETPNLSRAPQSQSEDLIMEYKLDLKDVLVHACTQQSTSCDLENVSTEEKWLFSCSLRAVYSAN